MLISVLDHCLDLDILSVQHGAMQTMKIEHFDSELVGSAGFHSDF